MWPRPPPEGATKALRMSEFKLPEIGEGVIEGEIVRWLVQPGEPIQANQGLVEVMTDKATIEVPASLAGTMVEHRAAEGDICAVGAVIAILEEGGAAPAIATRPVDSTGQEHAAVAKVLATPAARHLARSAGIDLATVAIDERGRITKSDVLAHAERPVVESVPAGPPIQTTSSTTAVTATRTTPGRPASTMTPVTRCAFADRDDERIPFRGLRRRSAELIHKSYATAAHYTYVETIDVTRLVALRKQAKVAAAESGVNLSYLPFIIKAVVHGLKKYPIVNSYLDVESSEIVLRKRYHIGVAAATDQGLMVPVIRDADALSLLDLAREISRLAEGAKTGQLAREELSGSSFSVTSLGTIGGLLATPILNAPEVGILGVHAIRKTPIVDANDKIVIGHLMNLSVSFDHRIVDGFEGASFLQEVKRYLEDPTLLLLSSI